MISDHSDSFAEGLLAEDSPYGDLTTDSLGIADRPGRITFAARGALVLCGAEEAERLWRSLECRVTRSGAAGAALAAGEVFLTAEGPAGALHRGWKPAQTLVEQLSGIATAARRLVSAARAVAPEIAVVCTRKAFPGTRRVSTRAVLAGGALMHRCGLSDTVLVFPEHRVFLEEPAGRPVWLAGLKRRLPEKKIVVETADIDDAVALAAHGADVIQLEKLSPEQVRTVVVRVRDLPTPPKIAAAGGITEANAAAYAATGCDLLVTSAPYWARPADVKVTLGRLG